MSVAARLENLASDLDLRCTYEESAEGWPQVSVYSHDGIYRYAFATWWRADGPLDLWVGLNPGTGDIERRPRPTLARCVGRSKRNAAGLLIANLFAARHRQPKALRTMRDPVGPLNDEALTSLIAMAKRTIVAWGGNGSFIGARAAGISTLLKKSLCLGVTSGGQPRHPLYVSADASLEPWRAPESRSS